MGKIIAIIGGQWGDEAKGKCVDFLADDADIIARATGGNNAGHTVVVGDDTFKFHLLPSGIIHKGKLSICGNGMVIYPPQIVKEITELEKKGFEVSDKNLAISCAAHVITEEQVTEDKERGGKVGTTGRGIGPCYKAKADRTGLRMSEFVKQSNPEAKKLKQFVKDSYIIIQDGISKGKNILIEGAQGTLLDIDHGTYPYVTSSNSTAGGCCTGLGIGPTKITSIHAVMKAYVTRVGGGPFPTELGTEAETKKEESYLNLKETLAEEGLIQLKRKIVVKANEGDSYNQGRLLRMNGVEYGTTTGRPRRTGWFDAVIGRYAVMINGLDSIIISKLDVLSGLKKIKICIGYNADGLKLNYFPTDLVILKKCRPIYQEMDGWDDDISKAKSFDELPKNAKAYVKKIEELLRVPVSVVSIGPKRSQTMVLKKELFF